MARAVALSLSNLPRRRVRRARSAPHVPVPNTVAAGWGFRRALRRRPWPTRRAWYASAEGKAQYAQRAGIEGTLSQGVRAFGLRRTRYWGVAKTHLQHVAIAAGQTHCYPYVITSPGSVQAGSSRRNQARVTILNHAGHLGEPFGPSPDTDFSLPTAPTITERNKFAMVTDVAQCPAGFTCTPSDPRSFSFEDTGSVSVTTTIKNVSAECGVTFAVTNIATLVPHDTAIPSSISSTIAGIDTPACPPVSLVGCAFTPREWLSHPNEWPVAELRLGTVSYMKPQLLEILEEPVGENGLVSLAHQLIAAKLTVATGATTPASVANDITSADVLIGTFNLTVPPVGTDSLAPGVTSSLVSTLDMYNNGVAEGGAPHCQ